MGLKIRRSRFIKLITVVMTIFVLSVFSTYAGDIVFVINKDVDADTITKEELRGMFLGNISVWPGQKKVNIVIFADTETHKTFVRKYTQKTESQFQAWWKRKLFTGTGKIPPKFTSEKEVINYVAATEGGLGYVSSNASIGNNVKVLTVTDK